MQKHSQGWRVYLKKCQPQNKQTPSGVAICTKSSDWPAPHASEAQSGEKFICPAAFSRLGPHTPLAILRRHALGIYEVPHPVFSCTDASPPC